METFMDNVAKEMEHLHKDSTNMVGWSAGCGESHLSGVGSAGRKPTAERQQGAVLRLHLSSLLVSTEPTVLTTGWGRTEGPLWHAEGYVTFVDLAGSRLLRWDPTGQVAVVREQTGEGNGCTLDRQGRLIMCEGADHRRITRMDTAGAVTAIAERWQGKRFNKPNDIVCRSDGSIFFTDPELRLPPAQR